MMINVQVGCASLQPIAQAARVRGIQCDDGIKIPAGMVQDVLRSCEVPECPLHPIAEYHLHIFAKLQQGKPKSQH